MTYPNEALTEVCELLLEYGLVPEQIASLAADIHGECQNIIERRAEAAYERQQERLRDAYWSGHEDAHRRNIIEAGRGHLLR